MGNGILYSMICCNSQKSTQMDDVDINKNINDNNNIINYKDDNLDDKDINKDEINKIIQKSNFKKVKTLTKMTSSKKKSKKNDDTKSHRDPKIAMYNNTFQILNNTQQFISISNKINLFKNNLANNNKIYNSYNNSNSKYDFKNNSVFSRINNIEDIFQLNIKTKLILSGALFLNEKIEIDKFGMKNGLRKKHDGNSIFGIKNNNKNTNPCIYDYLIDLKNDENISHLNKKLNIGKVFEIFLDKKEKVYVLYFLHNSLLLYYKIKNSLFFDEEKEYYLILGDIFLTVEVKPSSNSNEKIINIIVEIEDEKPKKYSFEKKDVPIKIGRVNSSINIPKPSISKTHGIIDISNNIFFYCDMKSTNGSTLLLKEDDYLRIKGEMNFKLEDISFKIKEVENNEI
jgi:hypothetical protein